MPSSRPLPITDELTAPFWAAARAGALKIQRCMECRRYYQPPAAMCVNCMSTDLVFEAVSGRARVHSYTEMVGAARHPYFVDLQRYIVGVVELVEQSGLVMYTNFPGATLEDLVVGAEVAVEFETVSEECVLPQFRLTGAS